MKDEKSRANYLARLLFYCSLITPLQEDCFATETTEFFEFFSRVFSVNSVAELVFAVDSLITEN